MPTTNNNFSTLITAIDTKAQSLAASTTDPKDLVYLGKTLEALNVSTTVADIISQGDTQVTRVTTEGTTQVAAVQAAASGYVTQSDIDTSVAALVDSAPGTLNTLNELAAALGDDANFSTTITNSIATKLPLSGGTMTGNISHASDLTLDVGGELHLDADSGIIRIRDNGGDVGMLRNESNDFTVRSMVGDANLLFKGNDGGSVITALTLDMSEAGAATFNSTVTATGATINGTLEIDEVLETVGIGTTASGTQDFDLATRSVIYITANQTANRTINFRGDGSTTLNSMMAVGQSISCAALMTQGSSAYYLNAFHIDGTASWNGVLKWQGGSAPTSGNASGIDVYTFSIIKTADATFTVLASVSQFA